MAHNKAVAPKPSHFSHRVAMKQDHDDNWQEMWNARLAALQSVLGQSDGTVLHSPVPFLLGGQADVVRFRSHISGCVATTCELLGEEGQIQNELGSYELMIAHRDDESWGAAIISQLARYTCETRVDPGDTMEIGPAVPQGSTIAAFLFCEYARFKYEGVDAGLLLCLGITADELKRIRSGKRDQVLEALRDGGVYPYTDLYRPSI